MTHALREIDSLASTASALPGGSPNAVTLNVPQDPPEVAVAKANVRSNLANATVKAASDKLYRTQQTYFNNIQYLHKANESLADATEKLGRVRDDIARLDTEKVTLV
jgi:fructose/tagatose bisphosphate aldolase